MIEELEHAIDELGALHSRLILLVGPPQSGKTSILRCLSERRTATPLNVGTELGRCLAGLSHSQRALSASGLLRELADRHTSSELLLVDNIELLFDRSLKLDPF
jgi:chloramphenicol 3-O-phosphotransferase